MCFSAVASFSSAGALTVVGVFGLYFAMHGNKRFFALNLITLFYAIQQFSEGMIWIHSPILTSQIWGEIFLFFAFFIYPWFAGVGCYFLTRQPRLKRRILWVIFAGIVFGLWAFSNVLLTPDLGLDQCRRHIYYDVHIMGGYSIDGLFMHYVLIPIYIFLTSAPFFITDKRNLYIVGLAIIVSSIICCFIYFDYFISVWCFYAAIITLCISALTYFQWQRRRSRFYVN